MLDQKTVIEYANKGINKEIEELDKVLREGAKMIGAYYKGETLKIKLSIENIENFCRAKNKEMKKLEEMKNDLKFQLLQ